VLHKNQTHTLPLLFPAQAICSHITGGTTYAVLLDSEAYARGSSCTIDGPCHVTGMPGEPEHSDSSDLASDDSVLSSASPVAHMQHQQHQQHQAAGSAKPAHHQPVTREAFKAAVAAKASAAAAAGAAGCILPGGAAAAHLMQSLGGSSSPFGSSNGSVVGSAYEFEGGPDEDLVQPGMCVADKAAAAALFPPEQGAFGRLQAKLFGRY
jgi:hypothetical protein